MNEIKINELDDIVMYKNAPLFTLALTAYIISNRLFSQEVSENNYRNLSVKIERYSSKYYNLEDNKVGIDLVITPIITIPQDNGSDLVKSQPFTFDITVALNNGVSFPKINNLACGNISRKIEPEKCLSKKLLPYVSAKYYEAVASEFLCKYCPDALEKPIPLPVDSIVAKMGFVIEEAQLKSNIKGFFAFRPKQVTYFDKKTLVDVKKGVGANTIIIDQNLDLARGDGVVNDTIIHECLHWFLHRKYIELENAIQTEDSIPCASRPLFFDDPEDDEESTNIMEAQCKGITPLILMPKNPSIVKFNQLLEKYMVLFPNLSESQIYDLCIDEFKNYYKVTRISTVNRLRQLGYNENLNFKSQKSLLTSKGKIRFISRYAFELLKQQDRTLKELSTNGFIAYVDGYVVINEPDFVTYDKNFPTLSENALNHINECTLSFDIQIIKPALEKSNYAFLCSTEPTSTIITCNTQELNKIVEWYKHTKDENEKRRFFSYFRCNEANCSYSQYLHVLMTRHEKSVAELSIASGVSESVIKKYRSMTEQKYTVKTTLALCAGLKLYPYESLSLLFLIGWQYKEASGEGYIPTKTNEAYYHLVTEEYDAGIKAWNKYLKEHNESPLT